MLHSEHVSILGFIYLWQEPHPFSDLGMHLTTEKGGIQLPTNFHGYLCKKNHYNVAFIFLTIQIWGFASSMEKDHMKGRFRYFTTTHGATYAMRINTGITMQLELYAGNLDTLLNQGKAASCMTVTRVYFYFVILLWVKILVWERVRCVFGSWCHYRIFCNKRPHFFATKLLMKMTKSHSKLVQEASLLVCIYNPDSKFDGYTCRTTKPIINV